MNINDQPWKVSSAGWFCVRFFGYHGNYWLPMFKLTDEQLDEYNETAKMFSGMVAFTKKIP